MPSLTMPVQVFGDRSTELVFNDYLPSITCPWIALERSEEDMCHSSSAVISSMQRVPHIGWQIKSYFHETGEIAWLSAAAGGALSIANGAVVASHFSEENTFEQPLITGVTYAAGVNSSGGPIITAKPPAGTDRSTMVLSADQASFPSPDTGNDPVTMDRVYKYDGVEPWDTIQFQFYAPSSAVLPRGTFATGYFSGPAGVDAAGIADVTKKGTGHYAMKVRADGRAHLWEYLVDGSSKFRFSFAWKTDSSPIDFCLVVINVIPRMWQDGDGNYQGDRISFLSSAVTDSPGIAQTAERMADLASLGVRGALKHSPVYNVPRLAAQPTEEFPIRVDLARDCRASFMPFRHVYRDSGYLIDDYFALDQAVTTSDDFAVYLQGTIPSGTTVAIHLFDETGASLSNSTSLSVFNTAIGQTAYQSFAPTDRMRFVRMQVTATSNATTHVRTPTIVRYAIYRAPGYNTENPLELVTVPARETGTGVKALPRTTIESVTITPQETDPGAESATFTIVDLTGELEFLGERNMIPVLCRTKYDPDPELYADLFRGYVLQATSQSIRWSGAGYPAKAATRWTLQCVGEWARATETLTPKLKTWGSDPTTGDTYRATDVIRYNGEQIYPASMVSVEDIDITLQSADPSSYLQEANTRCVDTMHEMAQDYLGAYMRFDEAAGAKGILRMLLQKHAPYNNLAIFEIEHPTILADDDVPRLPHWAKSYAPSTSGDQEIQHIPIRRRTYTHWLEKAEGNCVVVHGTAIGADANASGAPDGSLLCQVAVHTGSYNFLGLDPADTGYPDGTSPEFYNRLVPIRCTDFKLGSQEAVDWKCRRIFEKACYSRFYLSFDAPMIVVTDTADDLQVRPRRLKFYDPVQVRQEDGSLSQFLVVSCTPSYSHDGIQMARYVLVTQSNIDTIGIIDRQASGLQSLMKALGRVTGANWLYGGAPRSAQQKQGEHLTSQLLAMPTPTSLPIQDLDPSSPTFGQFINMASYDAIPHA